jgi:hypothetical protein
MTCDDHDTREVSVLLEMCYVCGDVMFGDTDQHAHDDTREVSVLADSCADCGTLSYGNRPVIHYQ